MVNGITDTMKVLRLAQPGNFTKFNAARREVKFAGTALDMVLQTTALALYGTGNLAPRFTSLEKNLGWLTNMGFIANALSPWNAVLKQTTGIIAISKISSAAQRWAEGTISKKDKLKLLQLNINEDDAKLLHRLYKRFGEDVEGVRLVNTQDWAAFGDSFTPTLPKGYKIVIGKNTIKNNVYVSASHNRKTKTITLDEDYIKGEQFKSKAWRNPKVEGVRPIDYDFETPQEWFDFVKSHEIMHAKFPPYYKSKKLSKASSTFSYRLLKKSE